MPIELFRVQVFFSSSSFDQLIPLVRLLQLLLLLECVVSVLNFILLERDYLLSCLGLESLDSGLAVDEFLSGVQSEHDREGHHVLVLEHMHQDGLVDI